MLHYTSTTALNLKALDRDNRDNPSFASTLSKGSLAQISSNNQDLDL